MVSWWLSELGLKPECSCTACAMFYNIRIINKRNINIQRRLRPLVLAAFYEMNTLHVFKWYSKFWVFQTVIL